jgi:predicted nuclease with RNAse H fold
MRTVGVDVGGIRKGFHAVVNQHGNFLAKFHSCHVDELVEWILNQDPTVVAIDAPSMFSFDARSRDSERALNKLGVKCFYTPTRELAKKSHFYDWVFNGERLFQRLNLPIYSGDKQPLPCAIETFPHGVHLHFWKNHPANFDQSKVLARKTTLTQKLNYNTQELSNIDYIDAALCAVCADYFTNNQFIAYGNKQDGFIVLPG